jgi:hypothetical protein
MPQMIEIGIISIVVLAVGYWVTLWLMGRHDDVLHGDFVHEESGADPSSLWDQRFPAGPSFPAKPLFLEKPAFAERPPFAEKPSAGAADVTPVSARMRPAQPVSAPNAFSERSDTLQSLLASIKQDLKDASQL